jgi:hypothetical protein
MISCFLGARRIHRAAAIGALKEKKAAKRAAISF